MTELVVWENVSVCVYYKNWIFSFFGLFNNQNVVLLCITLHLNPYYIVLTS